MKVTFRDSALADIFEYGRTFDTKYKQFCRNRRLVDGFKRVVSIMYSVESTEHLRKISFLHYEKLKYQREEPKSSVRLVNGKIERLIFTETGDGIEVELIEINNTHYGNK